MAISLRTRPWLARSPCFSSLLFFCSLLLAINPFALASPSSKTLVKRPFPAIFPGAPRPTIPLLGQPLQGPGCSPQFGHPTSQHCIVAIEAMELEGTYQTTAYYSDEAARPYLTQDQYHMIQIPRVYSYGDCVVVIAPRADSRVDHASKDVMVHTAATIAAQCVVGRREGGFSLLGVNRGLTVALWELPPPLRIYGTYGMVNHRTIWQKVVECIQAMAMYMAGFNAGASYRPPPPPRCGGLAWSSSQQASSAADVAPPDLLMAERYGAHLNGLVCFTEGNTAPCGWGYECQQKKFFRTEVLWGVVQSVFPAIAGYCAETVSNLS